MFSGFFDAFLFLTFNFQVKTYIFDIDALLPFITWESLLKGQNNSKFIKKQEVLTK